MRCNIPKDVMDMSPSQRQRIAKYYTQQAYNLVDQENERVQEVMIKGNCIMLAKIFGYTEEQMKERFPTCGFPQFRIDELKNAEEAAI